MDNFLRCLCDNDLSALGQAPEDLLTEVWIVLISEFQELRGDTIDGVDQLRLTKLVKRNQNHLYIFELCVQHLEYNWSDRVAASLRKLGYPFNPRSHVVGEYRNDLQNCIMRSKTYYVQMEGWLKELEQAVKKVKPPTRAYFESAIIQIEEMQHVGYDLKTMTAAKFVLLEKKYVKMVERLNSKRHGK